MKYLLLAFCVLSVAVLALTEEDCDKYNKRGAATRPKFKPEHDYRNGLCYRRLPEEKLPDCSDPGGCGGVLAPECWGDDERYAGLCYQGNVPMIHTEPGLADVTTKDSNVWR